MHFHRWKEERKFLLDALPQRPSEMHGTEFKVRRCSKCGILQYREGIWWCNVELTRKNGMDVYAAEQGFRKVNNITTEQIPFSSELKINFI